MRRALVRTSFGGQDDGLYPDLHSSDGTPSVRGFRWSSWRRLSSVAKRQNRWIVIVAGSFLFAVFLFACNHTGSSTGEASDVHVVPLAASETSAPLPPLPPLPEPAAAAPAPAEEDARPTWGRGQQRRQQRETPQAPPPQRVPEEEDEEEDRLPKAPMLAPAEERGESIARVEEEEEQEAEELEVDRIDEEGEEEERANIFDEDAVAIWKKEEEEEEEDEAALEEQAAEEAAERRDDTALDDGRLGEEEEGEEGVEGAEEVEEGEQQEPQMEEEKQQQQQQQQQQVVEEIHEEEEEAAATAANWQHHQQLSEEEKVVVPHMLYCLPGGGFNDIVVQLWRCVEYAVKTQRVLILGFENYLPVLPPYEHYFRITDLPGLKIMSQWQAASIIRQAEAAGQVVTHTAGKRLDMKNLLGTGEEREDGPPFFINAASLPNYVFYPDKTYTQHVVVYHKKGNRGTPETTLQHLLFSTEVKHTFLQRWNQLDKPYIGMHVRGTDRKCGIKKAPKVLKKVQKLRKRLKGAPVYLATDNPEAAAEHRQELEERQGREIVSFTYYPARKEEEQEEEEEEKEEEEEEEGFLSRDGKVKEEEEEEEEEEKEGEGRHHLEGAPVPLHLTKGLTEEEKHQTNIDGFVDLLLLAFSQKFIMSCGGYSHLARLLHGDKSLALGLLGLELPPGSEDVDEVLEEALRVLGEEEEGKDEKE